jgi:homoserine dehydrogenase
MTMRKKIKIGLFGFGCVGQGLYEVIRKTPSFSAEIKGICVKDRNKQRTLPAHCFVYDMHELLDDPGINVIVELIDDAGAAYHIVTEALKRGKAVVSANKKMIAEHLEELLALQRQFNAPLLYEAACCASIPVIRNLEEYYDNDLLYSIEGIINGSTNYILTRTSEEGIGYDAALKQAQQLGFAESNPSLDVSGQDAANKLVILIAHAFGAILTTDCILTCGIEKLGPLELAYAREKNMKIKLVARAYRTKGDSITALVMPQFVSQDNWLYSVNNEFNGLITRNTFSDTQFFVGKGAGSYPTASAVLSDISALSYDYRYEYKKIRQPHTAHQDDLFLKVFCRHRRSDSNLVSAYFTGTQEYYTLYEEAFITGVIGLSALKKLAAREGFACSLVVFDGVVEKESIAGFSGSGKAVLTELKTAGEWG